MAPLNIGSDEFSLCDLKHAIQKLKNCKAAGPDEILNVMLKASNGKTQQLLLNVLNSA